MVVASLTVIITYRAFASPIGSFELSGFEVFDPKRAMSPGVIAKVLLN